MVVLSQTGGVTGRIIGVLWRIEAVAGRIVVVVSWMAGFFNRALMSPELEK
jgi:hypothetical protein